MKASPTPRTAAVGGATRLDARSVDLRRRIIGMLAQARRGHLGAALSLVEIIRVLYDDVLRYDPQKPAWPERDRFILSKGHGCLALYVILAEKGFFPQAELGKFCQPGGILGGHPEYPKTPGVEASTGSLGHGLSLGVGLGLSARHDKSDRRVFVVIGDGEANEGSIWEGALCAAKHGLDNLTVLVDCNKQQSYGPTSEVLNMAPLAEKWRAFGFAVTEVDGHDVTALRAVLGRLPLSSGQPSAIICHTIKGKGISFIEGDLNWHHKSRISDDDLAACLSDLEKC